MSNDESDSAYSTKLRTKDQKQKNKSSKENHSVRTKLPDDHDHPLLPSVSKAISCVDDRDRGKFEKPTKYVDDECE